MREADINETYLQPFVSYTTQDAWTVGLNTESTYYWTDNEASVPINLTITKLVRLGGAAISFGPGVRYWVEDFADAAHGWGFRFEYHARLSRRTLGRADVGSLGVSKASQLSLGESRQCAKPVEIPPREGRHARACSGRLPR